LLEGPKKFSYWGLNQLLAALHALHSILCWERKNIGGKVDMKAPFSCCKEFIPIV
jgi:hypothetical protein